MLEVYDFLGRRGGCFYTIPASHSVPFVPLENPEILKRAQKDEPGVLATDRETPLLCSREESYK